jgi:hypothetical protein
MSKPVFHLAQANLGRMRGPIDSPVMAGFVAQLDYINSVADNSPGFVWRLQTDEGDATAVQVFDDDTLLFNMSVWESVEDLHSYVYRSDHQVPLRDRKQWFERFDKPFVVLWWVPAGHSPTVREAEQKFELLWSRGPSPEAFTFKSRFPPLGSVEDESSPLSREECGSSA